MDKVRQDYGKLLLRFQQQQKQIQNLNQLYIKFRNLKEYQQQYDRNQELKKQLQFWGKAPKSARQVQLQTSIAMLSQHLLFSRDKLIKQQQAATHQVAQKMQTLNINGI